MFGEITTWTTVSLWKWVTIKVGRLESWVESAEQAEEGQGRVADTIQMGPIYFVDPFINESYLGSINVSKIIYGCFSFVVDKWCIK